MSADRDGVAVDPLRGEPQFQALLKTTEATALGREVAEAVALEVGRRAKR